MFYLDAFGMWTGGFEMSPRRLGGILILWGYFYCSNGDSVHIGLLLKPVF